MGVIDEYEESNSNINSLYMFDYDNKNIGFKGDIYDFTSVYKQWLEKKTIVKITSDVTNVQTGSLKEKFVQNLSNDYSLDYINSIIGEPVYKYLVDGIVNNYYIY